MYDTFMLVLTGSVIVLTIISAVSNISQTRSEIARMNLTLNKIAQQVGVPDIIGVPDTIMDELKDLILKGEKIKAIKKYRMATGVGLVKAKEYIDALSEKELK